MYTVYLFTQERVEGGGGELTREKVKGATVHKAGSKIPTYTLINTCHLQSFF
jgi:hypothetical protein